MENNIILEIDDIINESRKGLFISFKGDIRTQWVSKKQIKNALPGAIVVPRWYYKKYLIGKSSAANEDNG